MLDGDWFDVNEFLMRNGCSIFQVIHVDAGDDDDNVLKFIDVWHFAGI